MYPRLSVLALLAGGLAAAGAAGGRLPLPPPGGQTAERPTFSARAELVVLHAVVKDRSGRYVTGLPADAFTIVEDGMPQQVQFFGVQDAPVTVGLVIDGSGSMLRVRERLIAAVETFAGGSRPDDELFALTFNEHVATALPSAAPFTDQPSVLRAALARVFTARGLTALYDAVSAGLAYVAQGHHAGKVLIVVGDGGDNASRATFEEVLRATQVANTTIYTVALADPLDREANPGRLRRLAEASGGEAFRPDNAADVAVVLAEIARDIRNTYTLGYVPGNAAPDGRFRRVRVLVGSSFGRGLRVRAREGYVLDGE